jgi:hypothetical protein
MGSLPALKKLYLDSEVLHSSSKTVEFLKSKGALVETENVAPNGWPAVFDL